MISPRTLGFILRYNITGLGLAGSLEKGTDTIRDLLCATHYAPYLTMLSLHLFTLFYRRNQAFVKAMAAMSRLDSLK